MKTRLVEEINKATLSGPVSEEFKAAVDSADVGRIQKAVRALVDEAKSWKTDDEYMTDVLEDAAVSVEDLSGDSGEEDVDFALDQLYEALDEAGIMIRW